MLPLSYVLTLTLLSAPLPLPQGEEAGAGYDRRRLRAAGIDTRVALTTEFVAVPLGGAARGTRALSNLDVQLELDCARAGLWNGGRAFLYFLDNRGGAPSELVGDVQATSNIEADGTFKLYEAYYEHAFLGGRVSVLAGLHDLNSEFYALDSTEPFLQSSFGIGPEFSQVPPSIFPTTALGVRLRIEPTATSYLQYAVYDGVPGDPDDSHGTQVILDADDGLLHAVELGLQRARGADDDPVGLARIAVGAWYLDRDFADFAGTPRRSNSGVYAIAERTVAPGLACFVQLGLAADDRNECGRYFGAGLTWTGFATARPDDVLGLGVAHARSTAALRRIDPLRPVAETAIELTWRAQLRPWLTVQPDIQYVIDPGTDRRLDDALVLGLRLQMQF